MLGKRPVKRLDAEGLYAYAIRLLGARSLSIGEVRVKLSAKAAAATDVEPVLGRLREYGFLNDQRFAEGYAAARRDNETHGRFRVLQDLRKRRVAPGLAETAAREAFAGIDEAEQAQAFLERKYRGKDLGVFLSEERHAAQAYRRLRTAGFGSGAAIRALKRFTIRADELESLEDGEPGTADP